MIEAGSLRQRVTLLRPSWAQADEYGQKVMVYTPAATVWAQVVNNGGGTGLIVSKTQITYQHTIKVRWSSLIKDLDATWRVQFRGREMEIASVTNVENLNGLFEIEATEERKVG